ncbi:hypothetical protein ABIF64_003135 [Bradyrhizobium japonicum]|nr:integrase catalytic subunit [Bradyrhizobium japonicum SEMIA 5079]MCS3899364.1 hypothetical protein [Bradyrhizobium japonicum USDA 38]MCS3980565.1 hypothetical protein [Bradyrhizobium japonicum]
MCRCWLAKPGALRNGAPFKDWELPAALERIRRRLASTDDGNRQMVDILNAVLTDGLPAGPLVMRQGWLEFEAMKRGTNLMMHH